MRRVIFICLIAFVIPAIASAKAPLKAVFIRDQQLWMLDDGKEHKLTTGMDVQSPKWSHDGRFIAYLNGVGEESSLYVYDTKQKENYQPFETQGTYSFQWSPINNQIAFNFGVLNVTHTKTVNQKASKMFH